jgi:hypothetical protein
VEDIELIHIGIAALFECGMTLNVPAFMTYLAEAQMKVGSFRKAFETIELALKTNTQEFVHRPEIPCALVWRLARR